MAEEEEEKNTSVLEKPVTQKELHDVLFTDLETFANIMGQNYKLCLGEIPSIKTSATDGHSVWINTASNVIAKSKRDFHTLLNHESAHILFKSTFQIPYKLSQKLDMDNNTTAAVYNILEDYRIEELWGKLYSGTIPDFERIKQEIGKGFKNTSPNPISVILAARVGDKNLVSTYPKDMQELYDFVAKEMSKLQGKGFKATYPVEENILRKIKPYYEDKAEKKMQEEKNNQKGNQGQQSGQQGQQGGKSKGQGKGSTSDKGKPLTKEEQDKADKEEKERKAQEKLNEKKRKLNTEYGLEQHDTEEALKNDPLNKEESKMPIYPKNDEYYDKIEKAINELEKKIESGSITEAQILNISKNDADEELEAAKISITGGGGQRAGKEGTKGLVYDEKYNCIIRPSVKIRETLKNMVQRYSRQHASEGAKISMPQVIKRVTQPTNTEIKLYKKYKAAKGNQFWILLDTSGSMAQKDKMPVAKNIIGTLYDSIAPYDKDTSFNFIGFSDSGHEFTRADLTKIVPHGGTQLPNALDLEAELIRKQKSTSRDKITTLVVTDGISSDMNSITRGIGALRQGGNKVFTIFIGNPEAMTQENYKPYFMSDKVFNVDKAQDAELILENIIVKEIAKRLTV